MAKVTESMRAAARENGKRGGRPKGSTVSLRLARARRNARRFGERVAVEALQLLNDAMRGKLDLSGRERCEVARDFLDRFGYPRLAQQQNFGEFPTKLYELSLAPPAAGTSVAVPGGSNGADDAGGDRHDSAQGNGAAEPPVAH